MGWKRGSNWWFVFWWASPRSVRASGAPHHVLLPESGFSDQCADDLVEGLGLAVWVPITPSTSCDQAIFVDQATDGSLSSDAVLVEIDRFGQRFQRRGAVQGAVRPMLVVVALVIAQDPPQMVLVPDEGAVQELASPSPDPAFGDRVAPHRQLHLIRAIGTVASA